MTRNAHGFLLRALLCFSCVAGIVLTGCNSSSPTPPNHFKSTWRIPSSDLDIRLPLSAGYDYDFIVRWGDGSSSEVKAYDDPAASHKYNAAGDYTITIVGTLETWYLGASGDRDKILTVENFGRMGWKYLDSAFGYCDNLTTFKGGDVSQVTNMSNMFSDTSSLEQLYTSNWDVSSVTDMSFMFHRARSLEQLYMSNWDVSSVTDMSYMFDTASSLEQLDLSNWNVSSVENMNHMFSSASSLKQLNLSNWDVSSVEDMSYMFNNASSLEQLDLSNWDFGSVTTMENIFEGASELTTESYSEMLMQIVDTSNKDSITLGGGPAKYNDCGAEARAELVRRGWIIADGGPQDGGVDAANCTEWSPSPP